MKAFSSFLSRLVPLCVALFLLCATAIPVASVLDVAMPRGAPLAGGAAAPSYNIYFGDLHLHTTGEHQPSQFDPIAAVTEVRAAHRYARDVAGHDLVAVIQHDYLLSNDVWENLKAIADEYNEDGRFVSLPAYEYTNSRTCARWRECDAQPWWKAHSWGHRNVYWRSTANAPLVSCRDCETDTPAELFSALPGPGLALTIPHHPSDPEHLFDWSQVDARYDRAVEVFQTRGDFLPDILENGWRNGHVLGCVAGSDSHRGEAGIRPGITAVLAAELTREAIWLALYNRHSYATTNGDVLLHFFADGEIQGAVLSPRTEVHLSATVAGRYGDLVTQVELYDSEQLVAHWAPEAPSFELALTRPTGGRRHIFYLRVALANGHRAVSSPIWVEAPPLVGSGSITGTVWVDSNRNGWQAVDGELAYVCQGGILPRLALYEKGDAATPLLTTQVTTNSFAFAGLPAGEYRLQIVTAPECDGIAFEGTYWRTCVPGAGGCVWDTSAYCAESQATCADAGDRWASDPQWPLTLGEGEGLAVYLGIAPRADASGTPTATATALPTASVTPGAPPSPTPTHTAIPTPTADPGPSPTATATRPATRLYLPVVRRHR